MYQKHRKTFVPVIMQNGAAGKIDTSTLPKKDWKVHSGPAKVVGEEVHSLMSQKIQGTKSLLIQTETGANLSVTQGEAEVFAADYLIGLGYKIQAPQL